MIRAKVNYSVQLSPPVPPITDSLVLSSSPTLTSLLSPLDESSLRCVLRNLHLPGSDLPHIGTFRFCILPPERRSTLQSQLGAFAQVLVGILSSQIWFSPNSNNFLLPFKNFEGKKISNFCNTKMSSAYTEIFAWGGDHFG